MRLSIDSVNRFDGLLVLAGEHRVLPSRDQSGAAAFTRSSTCSSSPLPNQCASEQGERAEAVRVEEHGAAVGRQDGIVFPGRVACYLRPGAGTIEMIQPDVHVVWGTAPH